MKNKTNRLLSLLLAAAMALALLPVQSLAAEPIGDLNIPVPQGYCFPGDPVPYSRPGVNCLGIESTDKYLAMESYWSDDENLQYQTSGTFTDNRDYWLFIRLRAKDGWEWSFDENGSFTSELRIKNIRLRGTAKRGADARDIEIVHKLTLGVPKPLTITFDAGEDGGMPSVPSLGGYYGGNRLHMNEDFFRVYAVPPEGKVFFSWYLSAEAAANAPAPDPELEGKPLEDYTVTKDMTLYAGYVDALYSAALELTLPAAGDELTDGKPVQISLAEGETGYTIADAMWLDKDFDSITGAVENDSSIYLYVELTPEEGYGFAIDTDSSHASGRNDVTVTVNGAEITAVPQGNAGVLYFHMRFSVGEPLVHTVTFDGQGRGSFPPLEVADGESLGSVIGRNNLSERYGFDLELDGFLLNAWNYEDGTPVDFDAPVTGDLTVYAEWVELQIVREIEASLQTPRAGERVPTNSFAALGAGSGVYAQPPVWLDADMQPLADAAVFEAETQYYARISFSTGRLARFADELTARVNDTDVTASIERDGLFVTVLYPFIPSQEPRTGISAISLTVPEPLVGAEVPVPPQLTLEPEGCLLLDAAWMRLVENDELRPAEGAFEEGAEYALNVVLTARDGYAFVPFEGQITVTVNGEPAVAHMFYDTLIVYAPFTASASVTVTFDSMGGSEVPMQRLKYGDPAVRPEDPTREGWTFEDWYTSSRHSRKFSFGTPVTENVTAYALWHMPYEVVAYDMTSGREERGGKIGSRSDGAGAKPRILDSRVADENGDVQPISYVAIADDRYEFRCWRRDDPVSGEIVTTSARVNHAAENNLRLYAVFERVGAPELSFCDPDGGEVSFSKVLRWEGMSSEETGEPTGYGYDPELISSTFMLFADGVPMAYSEENLALALELLAETIRFSRFDGLAGFVFSELNAETDGNAIIIGDSSRSYLRLELAPDEDGNLSVTLTALNPAAIRLQFVSDADGEMYHELLFVTPGDVNFDGKMNSIDWINIMRWTLSGLNDEDTRPEDPALTVTVGDEPYNLWRLMAKVTDPHGNEPSPGVNAVDWITIMRLTLQAWKQ